MSCVDILDSLLTWPFEKQQGVNHMKTFSMFTALCLIRLCQMDKPATNFSRRSSLPSAFMKTEFLDGSYQDLLKTKMRNIRVWSTLDSLVLLRLILINKNSNRDMFLFKKRFTSEWNQTREWHDMYQRSRIFIRTSLWTNLRDVFLTTS